MLRPTENYEVLQLLENYIPTVFATFVEPFWVLLNRLLCVLQPFKDLWTGKTKSTNSIDATYTSIPPQLVFFRAIKSRHFTLMAVCSVALLANVLAVGMGALFNEEQTTAIYPATFTPLISPRIDGSNATNFGLYLSRMMTTPTHYQDHFYVALANATSGISLPPWVSSEFFFQPHHLPVVDGNDVADTYTLSVRGFGARANCTATPTVDVPTSIPSYAKVCNDPIHMAQLAMRETLLGVPRGKWATEYVNTVAIPQGGSSVYCPETYVMGWGRTEVTSTSPKDPRNNTIDASFAVCRPAFETAMFNVTVDKSGYVLAYTRTTDIEATLDYPEADSIIKVLLIQSNMQLPGTKGVWHGDTQTRDWLSHMHSVTTGKRDFLDPNTPPPDPQEYLAVFEPLHRKLFATLLAFNPRLFEPSLSEEVVTGFRSRKETRIFVDQPSFIMSMTVLAMNVVVAVVFYTRAVVFALPRMPTTIGSLIAYVAPSRIVNFRMTTMPGQQTRTFSFGRYVGRDGEVHLGIEMDPHVVRIDPSSLKTRSSLLDKLRLRKPRDKHTPVRSGTWV